MNHKRAVRVGRI